MIQLCVCVVSCLARALSLGTDRPPCSFLAVCCLHPTEVVFHHRHHMLYSTQCSHGHEHPSLASLRFATHPARCENFSQNTLFHKLLVNYCVKYRVDLHWDCPTNHFVTTPQGIAKLDLSAPRGQKECAVATIEYADGGRGGEAFFVPRSQDPQQCKGEKIQGRKLMSTRGCRVESELQGSGCALLAMSNLWLGVCV